MRAVFMGSDPIALPLLEHALRERPGGLDLRTVFTQPDRRTGRGMQLQPNAIKQWALERGIEVLQPAKCGAAEAEWMEREGIEVALVMAYGQILPRRLLDAVPRGFLNLHASLLPRLRGASPIHTAIACGYRESGVSLMRIIPQLDAGPVADVERVRIDPVDTAPALHAKLGAACPALLGRCLPRLAAGELEFTGQDAGAVSYCRIIEKSDCHLDFAAPAAELANRVRAFVPWPGTAFPFDGAEVRVLSATVEPSTAPAAPGTVLADEAGLLRIACGAGALRIARLQRPGGKPLDAEAFLRGFAIPPGAVLESRPMRPLESDRPFPYRRKGNSAPGGA
jgi:methionyl-tRNA formyltransferase